jgi:hypothetical protein
MEIRLHFEVVHLTGGCWMSSDGKIHRKDEKKAAEKHTAPPEPSRASQSHGKDDGNTALFRSPTAQERPRGHEQKKL